MEYVLVFPLPVWSQKGLQKYTSLVYINTYDVI